MNPTRALPARDVPIDKFDDTLSPRDADLVDVLSHRHRAGAPTSVRVGKQDDHFRPYSIREVVGYHCGIVIPVEVFTDGSPELYDLVIRTR